MLLLVITLVTTGVLGETEDPAHVVTAEPTSLDGGVSPELASDAGLDEHDLTPHVDEGDGGVTDAGTEVLISELPAVIERPGAVRLHLRLGFVNEWANQPTAPLGLSLGFRFGGIYWTGLIEAWGLMPSSVGNDNSSISVGSFGGITGVCYEHPVLSGSLMGCALGRAGAMRFEPKGVADLHAEWQPILAGGLRVGGEWPRESFLAFYVSLQGFVPIIRGSLIGADIRWEQKWFFGGAQVGFRMRLE